MPRTSRSPKSIPPSRVLWLQAATPHHSEADAAEAASAFEAIASVQGLSWGEKNVTAALYLGAPIEVAGKIVVDGSLTDAASAAAYNNNATVYVANQGILIVSQSQGLPTRQ